MQSNELTGVRSHVCFFARVVRHGTPVMEESRLIMVFPVAEGINFHAGNSITTGCAVAGDARLPFFVNREDALGT